MIYLPVLQATVETVGDEELTPKCLCLHIVQKHHSFTSEMPVHICKFRSLNDERRNTEMCSDGCYVPFERCLPGTWI